MNKNPIILNTQATEAVKAFRKEKKLSEEIKLRLAVQRGGCSGYSYHLGFDQQKPNDLLFKQQEIELIIDPAHLEMVKGLVIGHVTKPDDDYYTFFNPSATRSCPCGTSFNIDLVEPKPKNKANPCEAQLTQ